MPESKIQKKSGYGLQFYADFSRVIKGAEMKAVALKEARKILRTWFSAEGGFLFNKRAALDLAEYMRSALATGSTMSSFEGLSRTWQEQKANPILWAGRTLDQRMGVATGSALKYLRHIRSGYSEYRVGWTENDMSDYQIGNLEHIAEYMAVFEKGRLPAGWGGRQPPRPFVLSSFLGWCNERVPDLLKEASVDNLIKHFLDVYDKIQLDKSEIAQREVYGKASDVFSKEEIFEKGGASKLAISKSKTQKVIETKLRKSKIVGQVKLKETGELMDLTDKHLLKKGGKVWKHLGELEEEFEILIKGIKKEI